MDYKDVVKRLGACGLECYRCADYTEGEIKRVSVRLIELLGGYRRVAKMREGINPVFAGYPQFEKVLTSFAQGSCSGCRGDNAMCFVECCAKTGTREKGVDFCFQCGDFPCDKQFPGSPLQKLWLKINQRMKEIGVVECYEERKGTPRY